MSEKNKKQFGVWMDNNTAVVIGRQENDGEFMVLGYVDNGGSNNNSNENTSNNHESGPRTKFFKDIAFKMQNIDEIHISGTGQVQEQFMKFLAETPQYKNAVSSESTSNKMSDENLVAFFGKHYN